MDSFLYRLTAEEQTHFHDLLIGVEMARMHSEPEAEYFRAMARSLETDPELSKLGYPHPDDMAAVPTAAMMHEAADEIESGFTGGEELP